MIDNLLSQIEPGSLTPEQLRTIQAASRRKINDAKIRVVEQSADAHRMLMAELGEETWRAGYNVVRNELHPRKPRTSKPKTDQKVESKAAKGNGGRTAPRAT